MSRKPQADQRRWIKNKKRYVAKTVFVMRSEVSQFPSLKRRADRVPCMFPSRNRNDVGCFILWEDRSMTPSHLRAHKLTYRGRPSTDWFLRAYRKYFAFWATKFARGTSHRDSEDCRVGLWWATREAPVGTGRVAEAHLTRLSSFNQVEGRQLQLDL